MNRRLGIITTLCLLTLGACATAKGPKETPVPPLPPLNGMIYDQDNLPVSNAIVEIDGERKSISDVNGRFALFDLIPGKYLLSVRGEDYESASVHIEYSDPTQIVYVKLFSADQLLSVAEKAIETRDWQSAEEYLNRATAIRPNDTSALYLHAVLDFRQGKAKEALATLESLLANKIRDPYIYLFCADILQYQLQNPKAALGYLEKFLESRFDPEVEKRRDLLKAEVTGGTEDIMKKTE